MKKFAHIADRVLARVVPKTDAVAATCWWEYDSPKCGGFDAWCCNNNGGREECACTG